MMKNKRGWIRIVEAFVALLLIIGVVLITINKGYFGKNRAEKIHDIQASVLREIQLSNPLRDEILNAVDSVLLDGFGIESHISEALNIGDNPPTPDLFPTNVWNRIDQRVSEYNYLECRAKICGLNEACGLNNYPDKNVYTQPVAISASTSQGNPNLSPRQLKMFCWEK